MIAPLLALALAAAPTPEAQAGVEAPAPTVKRKAPDAIAVPLVGFNSDEKFGFGVAGGVFLYGDQGVKPYQHALSGQAYFTLGGIQSHFLRYDGPNFMGTRLRFESRLEYRREKFAPYFGPGNNSAPGFDDSDDRSQLYTYDRVAGGGWVRLRFPTGTLEPYVGYGFKSTIVRAGHGSLLADQRPRGIDGGATGQVLLGVEHDTRDDESDPSRGGTEEVSLRLSGPPTGSRYTYGQATIVLRRFVPLSPDLLLAGRIVGDWLFGDVPFFEWPLMGGLSPAEGIGGMSSVRGVARHRYIGNLKLLGNAELRATVARPMLFGEQIKVAGVLFADAGRAWAGETADGPWYRLRPAAGVGVRLVRGAAVVRADYGISSDRQSLYISIGHLF